VGNLKKAEEISDYKAYLTGSTCEAFQQLGLISIDLPDKPINRDVNNLLSKIDNLGNSGLFFGVRDISRDAYFFNYVMALLGQSENGEELGAKIILSAFMINGELFRITRSVSSRLSDVGGFQFKTVHTDQLVVTTDERYNLAGDSEILINELLYTRYLDLFANNVFEDLSHPRTIEGLIGFNIAKGDLNYINIAAGHQFTNPQQKALMITLGYIDPKLFATH
jgi:hypothetical protein